MNKINKNIIGKEKEKMISRYCSSCAFFVKRKRQQSKGKMLHTCANPHTRQAIAIFIKWSSRNLINAGTQP